MLAPREIGQEGFREGKVVETSLKALIEVGKELEATIGRVRRAPRVHGEPRQQGRAEGLPAGGEEEVRPRRLGAPARRGTRTRPTALATEAGALAARDPLTHGLSKAPVAYYRLPGPGRATRAATRTRPSRSSARSRTDAKNKDATYVFTNVDMFADAKRLKKAAKA